MLAELDDLVAIGSLPVDYAEDDAKAVAATRLLELISAQVVGYLRKPDEATLTGSDAWTDARKSALAAIVIEVASERLAQPGAANVDQDFYSRIPSVMLRPYHKKAIDEIFGRPGRSTQSIVMERDSSTSYLHALYGASTEDSDDE